MGCLAIKTCLQGDDCVLTPLKERLEKMKVGCCSEMCILQKIRKPSENFTLKIEQNMTVLVAQGCKITGSVCERLSHYELKNVRVCFVYSSN